MLSDRAVRRVHNGSLAVISMWLLILTVVYVVRSVASAQSPYTSVPFQSPQALTALPATNSSLPVPTAYISSHVLDIANGRSAEGMRVETHWRGETGWENIGDRSTNAEGRVPWTTPNFELKQGEYKVVFHTADYFSAMSQPCFYPTVEIHVLISDATQHYHIPLSLSNYGYFTYRGT